MSKRRWIARGLAAVLVVSLQGFALPGTALAGQEPAGIAGSIVSASDRTPMPGARLHVADPRTGKVYTSGAASAEGNFTVKELPPATYELAVESGERLFLVGTPVRLAPGRTQLMHLEVNDEAAPDPEAAKKSERKKKMSVWDNPGAAAGIVISGAVVLGFLVSEATNDDEKPASATTPAN